MLKKKKKEKKKNEKKGGDWKGTKNKENYLWSISVWYVCLCNFQFWNIEDDV